MMQINDAVLTASERVLLSLRSLYLSRGWRPYRMSKFEEYDLYAGHKEFLVSDNVITFTDTDGKLMALKPDVTLSLIKNSADAPEVTERVFYNENVYRVTKGAEAFREIMQAGVECFGRVGQAEIDEVLALAAESLGLLPGEAVLAVSDLDILSSLLGRLSLSAAETERMYTFIGERNAFAAEALLSSCADRAAAEALLRLMALSGTAEEALPALDTLLSEEPAYAPFRAALLSLTQNPGGVTVRVDFSVLGDIGYYNGIVFKGFLKDIPEAVLSGGQYDKLMQKLGRRSSAIGFAVYTDAAERAFSAEAREEGDCLNIALPKGRLGEKVYAAFAEAGYSCPAVLEPGRRLIFENTEKRVRYFWVKPSDVAIYVERGAADIGVAGKDILEEYTPDVYELLDLKKGVCRMAVAAPESFSDDPEKTLRVATKFRNVARRYYRARGRDIDIIHLNGSIELAPLLGLSDVIVDIVETGTTLRENGLIAKETVFPVSARLIANKAAYKFKSRQVDALAAGLKKVLEEKDA